MDTIEELGHLPGAQPIKRKKAPMIYEKVEGADAPIEEVKQEQLATVTAPPEYVEISLSSCGKLGLPAKLHVRDYLASDVLKLASITDETVVDVLLGILSNMIYEKIDVYKMHEKDMEEILVNIHLRFWGAVVENYPYEPLVEDYEKMTAYQKAVLAAGKDPFVTDVNLSKLKTIPIAEQFKGMFTIKDPEKKINVTFTLPRVGNALLIKKFGETKFSTYEEKFSVVKMLIRQQQEGENVQIDPRLYQEYIDFCGERDEFYLMLSQALLIEAFDGVPCKTIAEKIEAYKKISLQTWVKYNEVHEELGKFGIDPMIEIPDPTEEGKTVTRKCRFQLVDLIPSYRLPYANGFVVEY